MIEIFKKYYDKSGHIYTVLQYVGGKYLCESSEGRHFYFRGSDLYDKPKEEVYVPTYTEINYDFSNEETPIEQPKEEVAEKPKEEVKKKPRQKRTKKAVKEEQPKEEIKDNKKETAEDFYADLLS